MLNGDLEMAEYNEIKEATRKEILKITAERDSIMTNSEKINVLQNAENILQNLPARYRTGSPAVQEKIIGSIFSSKLIFDNGEFRTTQPYIILTLITNPQRLCKH